MKRFGFLSIMETGKYYLVSEGGDGVDLREHTVSTAMALYCDHGLHFTMQQVAEKMHVSKKTIYTVYPSKEALLLDMVDALFSSIHRRKQELIDAPGPIKERIRAVIIAMPEEYAALDFRKLDILDEKYPAVAQRVRWHLETGWEPTIALLEEGMAQGCIRRVSVPVLKRMISASIESLLAGQASEETGASYAETLETMIDIIMNGIRGAENEV